MGYSKCRIGTILIVTVATIKLRTGIKLGCYNLKLAKPFFPSHRALYVCFCNVILSLLADVSNYFIICHHDFSWCLFFPFFSSRAISSNVRPRSDTYRWAMALKVRSKTSYLKQCFLAFAYVSQTDRKFSFRIPETRIKFPIPRTYVPFSAPNIFRPHPLVLLSSPPSPFSFAFVYDLSPFWNMTALFAAPFEKRKSVIMIGHRILTIRPTASAETRNVHSNRNSKWGSYFEYFDTRTVRRHVYNHRQGSNEIYPAG